MKHGLCAAFAALFSFVVLVTIAAPAGAQTCVTIEQVTDRIRREAPEADIRLVDGSSASRLRVGIAALVGQAVPEGGSYLIAQLAEAPISYVVRFAGGCATHHGRFPDQLLRAWIDGSPA